MAYLLIFFFAILSLYFVLKILSSVKPEQVKKTFKVTLIIASIIIIIIMLRFGFPFIAAAFGVILTGASYFQRIIQFLLTFKMLKKMIGTNKFVQKQAMTRQNALETLGLSEGATTDEIIQAHRKMMKKNHPDVGGSKYIASQLNAAKDILLGK